MDKPLLAICIPTYNRADSLANCLNSIAIASKGHLGKFEVCISDNASDDGTADKVQKAKSNIEDIKYQRNDENLGIPRNFLNVVAMANAEFVWLLGDDDLLLPDALDRLLPLLSEHNTVDFFYLNSFHVDISYVKSKSQPFNTHELPSSMEPFSRRKHSGKLPFFDLIDPKTSFDFLGGMFLSAFRKSKWDEMVHKLDPQAIVSEATFSHFDNTFPHVKIWGNAFSNSSAYFNAEPMSACITGLREWAPLEPLVRNIRLIEALDVYLANGMAYWRYLYCKNFALRNYFANTLQMVINREIYPFKLELIRHYLQCAFYPNVYLSFFYLCIRKIMSLRLR